MRRVIKKILTIAIGNSEDFTFEERLVLSCILFSGITAFVSIFENAELNLGIIAVLMTVVAFLFYFVIYIAARIYRKQYIAKLFFTVFSVLLSNFIWFASCGSRGGALYYFLIFFFITIFAWDTFKIMIIAFAVVLNLLILFTIEMTNPSIVPMYPTEHTRISDTYFTLIVVLIFFSIIIVSAKNNYIKQYKLAQQSDRLKSAFLANMSHEIRTPLNAIMGFTNLLAERELTKPKKEQYAKLVNDSGNYLMKLVGDILDVSMIESGQLKINFHDTELNDLFERIHQSQKQIYREIKNSDVKLILSIPPESIEIVTDDIRLEQILSNLVSNAMKFTSKGQIKFGYIPDEDYILFFVEDTGTGIKEEFQPEIFNRFVKDESTADQRLARGAGIGLSLCKDLVQMLGGKIWFTSEYLKGTTFYFSIPQKIESLK